MNTTRTQEQAQDHLDAISEQIEEGIKRGKYTLAELQELFVDKTKAAARTTVLVTSWSSM